MEGGSRIVSKRVVVSFLQSSSKVEMGLMTDDFIVTKKLSRRPSASQDPEERTAVNRLIESCCYNCYLDNVCTPPVSVPPSPPSYTLVVRSSP